MKNIKSTPSLAKFLALCIIFTYPLVACSDENAGKSKQTESKKEMKGKNIIKTKLFKLLNKYTPNEVGTIKTIVLLDENHELAYVLAEEGNFAGKGTLGSLLKNNEKVVSTKSLNIIETKGSHHFYYCSGGNCRKINYPH